MDNQNNQNNNDPYQSGSGTDHSDPNHDNPFTPSPSSLEDPPVGRLKHSGPVLQFCDWIGVDHWLHADFIYCHDGYQQCNWCRNHTDPSGRNCIASSSCSGFSGCSGLSDT